MPPSDQPPRSADSMRPLFSKSGACQTRLLLSTCLRWMPALPQSRPGFDRSVIATGWIEPELSVSASLALRSDQVYDTWNCEPRPKREVSCVCNDLYLEVPSLRQKLMVLSPVTMPYGRSAPWQPSLPVPQRT